MEEVGPCLAKLLAHGCYKKIQNLFHKYEDSGLSQDKIFSEIEGIYPTEEEMALIRKHLS